MTRERSGLDDRGARTDDRDCEFPLVRECPGLPGQRLPAGGTRAFSSVNQFTTTMNARSVTDVPVAPLFCATPINRPSGSTSALRRKADGFVSRRPLRENGVGGVNVTFGVVRIVTAVL